jgi:chemotaxis response regulator CheB
MQPTETVRENSKVRVLVVDESPTARQRLREEIQQAGWLEIVAEAGNSGEAMTLFSRLKPDVVVLSISIGYQKGFEVLRCIRRASINCTTILTSRQSDPFVTETGLLLGAAAVCCVAECPTQLLSLLQHHLAEQHPQRRRTRHRHLR